MKSRSLLTSTLVFAAIGLGACTEAQPEQVEAARANLVSGAGEATTSLSNSWNGGYCMNVDVANNGTTPITDWTVTLDLKQSTLSSSWNVTNSVSAGTVTFKPVAWNKTIAPGAKVSVGFCANAASAANQAVISRLDVTGGGSTGVGGSSGVGGSTARGGSSAATTATTRGGSTARGGSSSIGGTTARGGSSATGGATSSTTAVTCSTTPLSGGSRYCSSTQGTLSNGVGYSVWMSNSTSGSNCGTFYGNGAAFKAQWNMGSGGDFLARAGLSWNETKTYDQLGTIAADYSYTKTGVANTVAFVGVYGWSNNPLVEYYIIDEWVGWNPASNATKKGTITLDGGIYDIYTHTQVNQPSIHGTATFPQYFSIRKTARQCGHISITEHFKAWGNVGLNLGKMYEAKLLVEAMGGTGTIDFTSASVTAR